MQHIPTKIKRRYDYDKQQGEQIKDISAYTRSYDVHFTYARHCICKPDFCSICGRRRRNSAEKSYTFTVNGETTLTAVYEDKPSGGGEITPPAKKDGLSGGQIAGIVIGSVAVAGIGGFAIFWFAVKKKTFADLGVALKKGFTAIGNFFKTLGEKIKAKFNKKK